jgi:hypothetical protein
MKKIVRPVYLDFSQYTLGRVVYPNSDRSYLGHIIGFTLNEYDTCQEIVIKVRWCDGKEYSIHPTNVTVL